MARNSYYQRPNSWPAFFSQKKEEIYIFNGIFFTFLLWAKLDHQEELDIPWGMVLTPLWISNALGMYCASRRIQHILGNNYDLDYEWWPQVSKNVLISSLETMIEEWASMVFKILLIQGSSRFTFIAKFSPLWFATAANAILFYFRKPHKGVIVKPRYIFALMVAIKLDGWNDFPWHFQFAPLWFLLSIVLCFVFMFALSVNQRRLSTYKRKAFMTAALATLVILFLTAVALIELAKYLEHVTDDFSTVAMIAILTQGVALFGLIVFGHYVRKDHTYQRQMSAAAAAAAEKAQEIVLQFMQAPEDVFIRESANLFRKHMASSAAGMSAKVQAKAVDDEPNPARVSPKLEDFLDHEDCFNEEECVICCDEGAEYIMLECGHGNFCKSCSELVAKKMVCPICRQKLTRVGKLAHKTLEVENSIFMVLESVALIKTVAELEAAQARQESSDQHSLVVTVHAEETDNASDAGTDYEVDERISSRERLVTRSGAPNLGNALARLEHV